MRLNDALGQIADIRQRMTASGTFRGYRAVPTALSGLLAFLAAACQPWLVGPIGSIHSRARFAQIDNYIQLWGVVAVLSLLIAGLEMVWRLRRSVSIVQRDMSRTAVEQFAPCLAAGALVSFVIRNFAMDQAWILPGLWMILFSQGLFASVPLLPRQIRWVGGFYLLAGTIALSRLIDPFNPWTMAGVFGAGQLALAGILYWTLERNDRQPEAWS